jgi:predicted RNA-binding Zn-ribbon protein involved in translation (DUF1610 family)
MVTGAEIAGGFAALKAVKELLKGAYDAKLDADVKAKVYDAMDKLGDAQDTMQELRASNYELLETNNMLKQELAATKAWQAKADGYELVKTGGEAVVYRFKSDPMHYACPSCFNKQEVHILQTNRTLSGKYRCTGCTCEFPVEEQRRPPPIDYQGTGKHWAG